MFPKAPEMQDLHRCCHWQHLGAKEAKGEQAAHAGEGQGTMSFGNDTPGKELIMRTKTLCLLARKGGIGRTSLVINVGCCLAEKGLKVLLVDMESQASLSQFFLGPEAVERLPIARTTAALFDDAIEPDTSSVIRKTTIEGVSLAPASMALACHESPEPQQQGASQFALRDFLAEVDGEYDVVLIDTPPFIYGMLSWASLMAANYLAVPVQPEAFSTQALIGVQQLASQAMDRFNPDLELLGYIINMKEKRSSLHNLIEGQIRKLHHENVFATVIPKLSAFSEAIPHQKSVTQHKPKSDAAKAIIALTDELMRRIQLHPTVTQTQKRAA